MQTFWMWLLAATSGIIDYSSVFDFEAVNIHEQNQLLSQYKGFPCNQFANQEPGTDEDIIEFVKKYNVTFDMFHKINVNGADAIPLFKWLKEKLPGSFTNAVKWNFTKFLCDRNGVPFKRYAPNFSPKDITPDIEKLLAQAFQES